MFQSILDLLLETSINEETFTHSITLFYHIWLKQYSNEHEQKRGVTRRRRAGEIAFVYQHNLRNESAKIDKQIIVIYIWKIDGEGYIYLENQVLNLQL